MITRAAVLRLFWAAVTVAAGAFAGFVVVDTLRAVVPLWSPLPWFDEWATVKLLGAVQAGEISWLDMLFAQHNEHRILVPRLVFLADDALFRGQGRLSLAAIFATQALHAGLFGAMVLRATPRRAGRWALVAVTVALMFSLRQVENFTYGFQVQFVGVFAGATLGFVLFGRAVARARAGRPVWPAVTASLAAVLTTTFTMANGLAAGALLPVLGLAARMRIGIVLACTAWAAASALVYLHGYEPVMHHSLPSDSLQHPVALTAYVATYLGSIWTSGKVAEAEVLGALGLLATLVALLRVVRRPDTPPAALALVGVMIFVGAAAAVTASGRLGFGIGQALSSRYATGSAAFWAAQLAYWWIDPPRRPPAAATRAGVLALAAGLCLTLSVEQRAARPAIASQSFALAESTDLLLLGLRDPAVLGRSAWVPADVERLLPVLRDAGLSIFATPEAAALGRPIAAPGGAGSEAACGGGIAAAVADPSLGPDGVRVSGSGRDEADHRILRRILLADGAGRVVGLASGAVPGAPWSAWRGFAVAPVGVPLTAFGWRAGRAPCRLGAAVPVAAAPAGAAPEP